MTTERVREKVLGGKVGVCGAKPDIPFAQAFSKSLIGGWRSQRATLVISACIFAALVFISGCATRSLPNLDVEAAGDSVLRARDSLALARSEGAQEYAPGELARAENFLNMAQEALRDGKSAEAANFAFHADLEAKVSAALAREAKARLRIAEVRESKQRLLWETKINEAAAAKARQAIAERTALEAQKESKEAKARAEREIQKAKAELAIAKAELQINSARQLRATEYAEEPYQDARNHLQEAKLALADDSFMEAISVAEEAARYASNASVQARARLEAELEESLRGRDRAVAAMTRAELAMEKAKEALAGQYAEDMYKRSEELLKESKLALEAREYDRAESLAEQAGVAASSALAIAEAKEREMAVREAQEDARANALDAVARAERSMAKAQDAGAAELAGDSYRKAQEALDNARKAVEEEDFDAAISLAQQSTSHSVTALTMAEAKTESKRKLEEIENNIMEEAGKIPEVVVRKTNRGIVISMGGDLFARGSSQIRNDMHPRLKSIAELLRKYPDYKVIVEGHTDDAGSDEANLKISTERAHNFLRYLVDQEGMPLERLSSVGYGESRPIASNATEEGRRQNRRVDVVILTVPVSH